MKKTFLRTLTAMLIVTSMLFAFVGCDNGENNEPSGGTPGAVATFTATAGNAQVTLEWTAPADNGGSVITGYEVTMDNFANKVSKSASELSHTYTGLTNDQLYSFNVRAVNANGAGAATTAKTAKPTGGGTDPGGDDKPGLPTATQLEGFDVDGTIPAAITGTAVTTSPGEGALQVAWTGSNTESLNTLVDWLHDSGYDESGGESSEIIDMEDGTLMYVAEKTVGSGLAVVMVTYNVSTGQMTLTMGWEIQDIDNPWPASEITTAIGADRLPAFPFYQYNAQYDFGTEYDVDADATNQKADITISNARDNDMNDYKEFLVDDHGFSGDNELRKDFEGGYLLLYDWSSTVDTNGNYTIKFTAQFYSGGSAQRSWPTVEVTAAFGENRVPPFEGGLDYTLSEDDGTLTIAITGVVQSEIDAYITQMLTGYNGLNPVYRDSGDGDYTRRISALSANVPFVVQHIVVGALTGGNITVTLYTTENDPDDMFQGLYTLPDNLKVTITEMVGGEEITTMTKIGNDYHFAFKWNDPVFCKYNGNGTWTIYTWESDEWSAQETVGIIRMLEYLEGYIGYICSDYRTATNTAQTSTIAGVSVVRYEERFQDNQPVYYVDPITGLVLKSTVLYSGDNAATTEFEVTLWNTAVTGFDGITPPQ